MMSSHSRVAPALAPALGLALLAAVAACSGNGGEAGVAEDPPIGAGEGGAAHAADAAAPASDGGNVDGGGEAGGDGGPPGPLACPTVKHGTIVVAGDSISNGAGAPPYYRTLLVTNDDVKYPTWKGRDLKSCWNVDPSVDVREVAKGGAGATVPANNDPTDMGVLLNQLKRLPASLPGPVLIVATIGGNDAQRGLVTALNGGMSAAVAQFTAGVGAALDEVTSPNRFGNGVKADVYLTNIYDPSGGTGAFTYAPSDRKCGGALGLWPAGTASKGLFAMWNDAMAIEVKKHAGARLLDMHGAFAAHGVNRPIADNWFVQDCIHPNAKGHDAIRQLFWAALP